MDAKCRYYVESCQDLVLRQSTVIRDGTPQIVNQESLVVGDLVILHRGDEVAADIKITESSGVKVLGAELTESEESAAFRAYYYTALYGKFYAERFFAVRDLLFQGSFIAHGHGKGVVLRTRSYYLSNVKLSRQQQKDRGEKKKGSLDRDALVEREGKGGSSTEEDNRKGASSLKTQIDDFLHTLSHISLAISASYGASIFLLGFSWVYAMMFFIAHYVGIITEALIPTFSVAKAQSAKELAYKNCYMQNIEALETLGTTSVILTNKTGVITQNRMIVSRLWFADAQDETPMASYAFIKKYKGVKLVEPVRSFVQATAFSIFAHFTVDKSAGADGHDSPFKRYLNCLSNY